MDFIIGIDGSIKCSKGLKTSLYENDTGSECLTCDYKCSFKKENNRITHEFNTFNLRCSFCGKSQGEVNKLIAGVGVYICNECIEVCNEIVYNEEINKDILLVEEIKLYTC